MADHQLETQRTIYNRLLTWADLIAVIGDGASPERARVYDNVPQGVWGENDQSFTGYVVIGDDTANEGGTKSRDGQEITVTIHTWSRKNGKREIKQMQSAIYGALHDQSLSVIGGNMINLRWEFAESFMDQDGHTRHGVQRFRMYVTD